MQTTWWLSEACKKLKAILSFYCNPYSYIAMVDNYLMDNKKSQIDVSDRGGGIGPADPAAARPIFILHSETDH